MPSICEGEHRFAPDIGIEKEMRVRQQGADAVEPSHGQGGPFQKQLPGTHHFKGRARAEAARARTRGLARPGRRCAVDAGWVAIHGASLNKATDN